MLNTLKNIPEWENVTKTVLHQEIIPSFRPAVLKGVFADWPIVQAGRTSPEALFDYVRPFDTGFVVEAFVAPPSINGYFFYEPDLSRFNFDRVQQPFGDCMARLRAHLNDTAPPAIYMGSTPMAGCLPGIMQNNRCDLLDDKVPASLWMGNATTVQTHYDVSDNIACVVAGHRRFTLFPPEQISNLYIGPFEFTPAGQPISMVSLENPDLERYPRFAEALKHAVVAELEPGDALYIPPLWWHNVKALDPFNVLINYWWDNSRKGPHSPTEALVHGMLTISSMPAKEREAWRAYFDHYVFRTKGNPVEHLPVERRGVLGEMTPGVYRTIRSFLSQLMTKRKM